MKNSAVFASLALSLVSAFASAQTKPNPPSEICVDDNCVTTPPPSDPGTGALDAKGSGVRYDVGPGKTYADLTAVPIQNLKAGSVINVFYRSTPYKTKLAIRSQGSAAAPIILNGVKDSAGNKPVIDCDGAVTNTSNKNGGIYSDSNPEYGEALACVLIKRASADGYGYKPKFITIQHLVIKNTYGKSFTAQNGQVKRYGDSAAGIWADVVEDLVLDDIEVSNNAFGIFVNNRNANGGEDAETSARLTVRHSRIFGNGKVGSYLEHNLYLQARGYCIVEDNFLGALRSGAEGSTYKDRCANSQLRRNQIEGSARAIDLVHDESGSSARRDSPTALDPNYDRAEVSGNTITANGATSCLHWGGDNLGEGVGPFPTYRNGPLLFKDNTCVLASNDWRVAVFDIQHVAGKVEASGNTISFTGSSQVRSWVELFGTVTLGANTAPAGMVDASDLARAGQYRVIH